MKKLIFLTGILTGILLPHSLWSQGCVAIRHFSSCNYNELQSALFSKGDWQIGMNYRYFKSFRHFRGSEEEPDRVSNASEVINHAHAWDFTATYGLSNRLYVVMTLPFVINTRSSLYEHGRDERHTTYSRGLADMRLSLGYWLFDPMENPGGNIAIGLGVKLPTGDFSASDIFYNVGENGAPQVRPVDQSIQPGDGGFGATFDIQVYKTLGDNLLFFASGFYLINPRETNGVRTFRETLSQILQNEAIMSVPDQYGLRGGFSYNLPPAGVGFFVGGRYEGVPVEDLVGGSQGFRRPGNVFSLEPGVSYMKGNVSINASVPIAVVRRRPQSVTDLETEQMTGNPRAGDAAFADYLINVGLTYRFSRPKTPVLIRPLDGK